MSDTLWLYWESPKGGADLPPYIALSRKSVELNTSRQNVTVVTPGTLTKYLPHLSDRLFAIESAPKGRVDKYFNRGKRRVSAIAQRADFVRAFLLEEYGGFYLDSDAILLADPTPYFSRLNSHDFCIAKRNSFGKSHAAVNFYGSHPRGVVISEYANLLRKRLEESRYYQWNEVGAAMITPVVDRHPELVSIVPESDIQPITFENAERAFTDTTLELTDVLSPTTKIFMLFSGPFHGVLKDATLDDLYRSDMLISKAFRAAVPATAYRELQLSRQNKRREKAYS